MFFNKKAPTWCFETDANDNNGNGSVFLDIYDRVYDIELHLRFANNLFNEFEKWEAQHISNVESYNWEPAYKEWIAKHAGLLWVQEDETKEGLESYRIIDKKLYTFALLRYS